MKVFGKRTLESCLESLGKQLLDTADVKAVMMSKDENGDVVITLVEGRQESHKVKFERVNQASRSLTRNGCKGRHFRNGDANGVARL
jgi:hypothetical protein